MKLDEIKSSDSGRDVVIVNLSIDYVDDNDNDKHGSVTVFHKCKSPEEAAELAKKIKAASEFGDDDDDVLHHYVSNAYSSVTWVHGPAYVTSVKTSSKEPAPTKKVFSFNPSDFGF